MYDHYNPSSRPELILDLFPIEIDPDYLESYDSNEHIIRISKKIGDITAVISINFKVRENESVENTTDDEIFELTTETTSSTELNNQPLLTLSMSSVFKVAKSEAYAITEEIQSKSYWIYFVIKIVIILLMSAISDEFGRRKPLIVFPMIGDLLQCSVHLFSAIFLSEIPIEYQIHAENIISSITGGDILLLVGIYSYITGKTTEDDRTFRFALIPILSTKLFSKFVGWGQDFYDSCGTICK